MSKITSKKAIFIATALLLLAGVAEASHSWGSYHWARKSNPFTLKLGDNVSSAWDAYLATASTDWSVSNVLDTVIVPGTLNPKTCRGTTGRIDVCNAKYGANGWLGIAQIWISGSHITKAVTKLNDTYFTTSTYNTPGWRQFVMCQEIGHDFGLDHQDVVFSNTNLGSCMDYTDDPTGAIKSQLSNEHPNQHDYDQLAAIYAHLDSSTTVGQLVNSRFNRSNGDLDEHPEWGKGVKRDGKGRTALYEKDEGDGRRVITHVFWAD